MTILKEIFFQNFLIWYNFRCLQQLFRCYLLKYSHTSMWSSLTGVSIIPLVIFFVSGGKDSLIWWLSSFYSLLVRQESSSFRSVEYLKAGIGKLEQWCCEATEVIIYPDSSRPMYLYFCISHFFHWKTEVACGSTYLMKNQKE